MRSESYKDWKDVRLRVVDSESVRAYCFDVAEVLSVMRLESEDGIVDECAQIMSVVNTAILRVF
jgi:hypothetical protein